ncbi:MAG TPA: hypothetical protein DGT23_19425 [Micromonosporaceae bacterium]|nr:hypothetical protein [Micromonosporaceae bacterium]
MPVIRGFGLGTTHTIRGARQVRYHVTFWEQPAHRWLIATVYHWYDSCMYRLPGFQLLERALKRLHRNDDTYVPLGPQQDIRCYFLAQQKRTVLATVDLNADDYHSIKSARQRSTSGGAPTL